MISDYFQNIERKILETEIVAEKWIDYREFSADEGMLRGKLLFLDGSLLEFMEYMSKDGRLKYRFHFMDKGGKMIFRYDNSPHHQISTFPHHKHIGDTVINSECKGLLEVIKEIEALVHEGRA